MLFFAPNDDELDEDLDEEEADADSDEDSDEEDNDSDDEESDDLEDLDDDEDSDDEEEDSEDDEDDDDKPVTRKELRDALKGNKNNRNARRRVSSKNKRDTTKSSDLEKTVAELKESDRKRQIAEKKLDFADANNLSRKQVNYVFKQTKRPTAKFLNKPHVKAALEAIKSSENVSRNTPSGSGKRFKAPGGKKWTELPAEERQANFADRRASILANKK